MATTDAEALISRFPPWAFITEMAGVPVGLVFLGLLLRRLRLVHPATWEQLGRPTLFISAWPIIPALERTAANCRLLVFLFRTQSFQLGDLGTAILLWLVRATLVLLVILRLWSWWANP